MFKNLIFMTCIAFAFAACGDASTTKEEKKVDATDTTEETKATTVSNEFYGEEISTENALTFTELLTKMDQLDSIETKVTGKVESVCKKKGCWVNIVSDDGREMFVKFKDYGFFLPLDCEGREVVMEGKAFREMTSVADLQHLAEDGGATEEEIAKITEPKEELKFMAAGVVLLPENKQ